MAAKALRPMGVSAASLPPETAMSISPSRMSLKASPRALVALAQAVTIPGSDVQAVLDGELRAGGVAYKFWMVKAETLSGPLSNRALMLDFDGFQAADSRSQNHPAAPVFFLGGIQTGNQRMAIEAALTCAYCTRRSNFLTSFGLACNHRWRNW